MAVLRVGGLALLLLATLFHQAQCWGALGHRTVAYIAAYYLTPNATNMVHILLNGQDISEAALWADKIRYIPRFAYSRAWHYIDAQDDPPRQCGLNFTRDCLPGPGCAVSALVNQTAIASDTRLSHIERGVALRWILHLIGDVHMPLHTEAEDRGGNEIPVLWRGRHTNLHSVWDTAILEKHAGRSDQVLAAALWAAELHRRDRHPEKSLESECQDLGDAQYCGLLWAGDANKVVCEYVLKDDKEGVEWKELSGDYYRGAVPVIEEMVAKAGRRLGAWLNALAVREAESERMGRSLVVGADYAAAPSEYVMEL